MHQWEADTGEINEDETGQSLRRWMHNVSLES